MNLDYEGLKTAIKVLILKKRDVFIRLIGRV